MSSNGDTNVVLRGVTHGAVDFLIKPVRVEELRNVWQHVVRRRSLHHSRAADEHSGLEVDHVSRRGLPAARCPLPVVHIRGRCLDAAGRQPPAGFGRRGPSCRSRSPPPLPPPAQHHGTKRKEAEALQVQHETQGANKKPRVVWSVEMHQQVRRRPAAGCWRRPGGRGRREAAAAARPGPPLPAARPPACCDPSVPAPARRSLWTR